MAKLTASTHRAANEAQEMWTYPTLRFLISYSLKKNETLADVLDRLLLINTF